MKIDYRLVRYQLQNGIRGNSEILAIYYDIFPSEARSRIFEKFSTMYLAYNVSDIPYEFEILMTITSGDTISSHLIMGNDYSNLILGLKNEAAFYRTNHPDTPMTRMDWWLKDDPAATRIFNHHFRRVNYGIPPEILVFNAETIINQMHDRIMDLARKINPNREPVDAR